MATGPRHTEIGDVVVLVPGLHYPVLLRPFQGRFLHVGLCYVAGLEPLQHVVDTTQWLELEEFSVI